MTPPPGWYADPQLPQQERWWDGTAWTDHRRPSGGPPAPPGPAAPEGAGFGPPVPPAALSAGTAPQGAVPPGPVPPGAVPPGAVAPGAFGAGPGAPVGYPVSPGGGSRRGRTAAVVASAVVLVAALVAGALALRGNGSGDDTPAAGPGGTTTRTEEPSSSSPEPSEASDTPRSAREQEQEDPGVVVDQLNGITLPLLDGWERPAYAGTPRLLMSTEGTYDCPGDHGQCRRGRVMTRTVTGSSETSPEAIARADVSDAADVLFDRDALDARPYGGVTAHRQVAAGPVAVAGRAGYYVRWRVDTAKGPGGYVQSVAFRSPVGVEAPVVVRIAFDAGEDGPPLADMDRITKGIRALRGAGTGGVGSGIGPSD